MPLKKTRMPDAIRLAGREFPLTVGGAAEGTMGQYFPMPGRIVLSDGLSDDQAKATVLHEMFHDFSNQSTNDLTEVQVNSMAALTFAALRDNPKLVAWLMS